MITTTTISVSPFKCRWIVPGSEHTVGCWSYAICVRARHAERIVNETDCSRCPRWESSHDDPESGTHA
jgi:hypothetical protein